MALGGKMMMLKADNIGDETMNRTELQATVETLNNLYERQAEINQAVKNQEQIIKDYMDNNNLQHLDLGIAVVHWTQVVSNVFDLKKFRADFGDVTEYMTERLSRRFKVA